MEEEKVNIPADWLKLTIPLQARPQGHREKRDHEQVRIVNYFTDYCNFVGLASTRGNWFSMFMATTIGQIVASYYV